MRAKFINESMDEFTIDEVVNLEDDKDLKRWAVGSGYHEWNLDKFDVISDGTRIFRINQGVNHIGWLRITNKDHEFQNLTFNDFNPTLIVQLEKKFGLSPSSRYYSTNRAVTQKKSTD